MMRSGKFTGLRIDKHCPQCGELYAVARASALVKNGTWRTGRPMVIF
jgi:hypothetical protein